MRKKPLSKIGSFLYFRLIINRMIVEYFLHAGLQLRIDDRRILVQGKSVSLVASQIGQGFVADIGGGVFRFPLIGAQQVDPGIFDEPHRVISLPPGSKDQSLHYRAFGIGRSCHSV